SVSGGHTHGPLDGTERRLDPGKETKKFVEVPGGGWRSQARLIGDFRTDDWSVRQRHDGKSTSARLARATASARPLGRTGGNRHGAAPCSAWTPSPRTAHRCRPGLETAGSVHLPSPAI